MAYSYTEKKRIRKDFSKRPVILEVPYLLDTQIQSYLRFLQRDSAPDDREGVGLHAAFKSVFPVVSSPREIIVSPWFLSPLINFAKLK